MPERIVHNQDQYRLRTKLPQYSRIAAVGVIVATILVVIVGFYRERSKSPFKLKGEHTRLSTDIVADVHGYERLETDGRISKFYIKADSARTFSDEHQELQNVYVETFDSEGVLNNKMTAESALYVPEADKNFTAYLKGNVQIETPDAFKIKTNNIIYTKKNDTAESDEDVAFERTNIRGRSFGANVKIVEKTVELLREVEIEAFESPELAGANIRYAKINTGSAVFDQLGNKIDLRASVAINIESKVRSTGEPRMTNVRAERASVFFGGSETNSSKLKRFEFFDDVKIVSFESGAVSTNINAGYASYDRETDRFDLKYGTRIVMSSNNTPTEISANDAIYEQSAGKVALTGNAEILQGSDHLKGELLHANLFPDRKIKDAVIRGNASARQSTIERTTTIKAPELNATFGDSRQLFDANAIGQSEVEIVPIENTEYSTVYVSAAKAIGMIFKGQGMIDALRTDGRTSILLTAPDLPGAANKRVTADAVRTVFAANGKDIKKAEAVGNAELNVEPLHNDKKNYRTTINAPRFDCEFFPTGNNAKICVGGRKTKTVRVPTTSEPKHGTQTLIAEQITAKFDPQTKEIEQLVASGKTKFSELDNHAVAEEMIFTQNDETLRLRGSEPTGWNSKYRVRAREIDWNTRSHQSVLRGKVSTTFYSLRELNNAAPFGRSDKPVFITSDNAVFDELSETAIYNGNARAWQENNYVHGDKFTLIENEGLFFAEGNVRSAVYNAKVNQKNGSTSVPIFAAANNFIYSRDSQTLHYRTNVDIRQGTDRITSNSADIYLNKDNEVTKTIAETNVVVSQPGRRGIGDWLQYTTGDEMAILRGNPAVIEDIENGSSQSSQLTLHMREKRVVSEGRSKQSPASRTKSVYKVKGNQ